VTKKWIVIFCLLSLSLIPVACSQDEAQPEDEKDEELGERDPVGEQEETPPDEEEVDAPTTAEGIPDGEYEGMTDKDERGNYGVATVTVEDEEIIEVEYVEYEDDDTPKSEETGYEYEEALEAFEALPEELLATQNVEEVDTYTGATGTSNKFRTAVKNALLEGKGSG